MTDQPPYDLPEGVPPLAGFYLYLVSGCNLACRHCWIVPTFYRGGEPAIGDCLDFDLLKSAVTEAKPMGLSHAKLTGGEPTLHPQFLEIADYLSEQGLPLVMETNATKITREMAHHLHDNTRLWHISVSIDAATAEAHDWFRNVPGAFDAALRGMDNLVEAGYRPQVIMCPYKGNREDIDAVVKLAVEHGAGSVKFNPVTTLGRGQAMHKHGEAFGTDEILEMARYVRGELQARTPIQLTIGLPPAFSSILDLLRDEGVGGSCGVRHIIGLLGGGEIALCGIGRSIPELMFGKLGRDSLRDVWMSNPVLQQLRRDLDSAYPGVCGDCIHAVRCLTHCVAQNYGRTGHLVWPDALCEDVASRGLFPAGRRRSSPSLEVLPDVAVP